MFSGTPINNNLTEFWQGLVKILFLHALNRLGNKPKPVAGRPASKPADIKPVVGKSGTVDKPVGESGDDEDKQAGRKHHLNKGSAAGGKPGRKKDVLEGVPAELPSLPAMIKGLLGQKKRKVGDNKKQEEVAVVPVTAETPPVTAEVVAAPPALAAEAPAPVTEDSSAAAKAIVPIISDEVVAPEAPFFAFAENLVVVAGGFLAPAAVPTSTGAANDKNPSSTSPPAAPVAEALDGDALDQEIERVTVKMLQMLLKPILMRREKKDVLLNLSQKREIVLRVPQIPLQKTAEKERFAAKNRAGLSGGSGANMLTNLMWLRKNAQHPALCWEPQFVESLTADDLIRSSPKLEALDRLLPKLLLTKQRVIIFSQFVGMLDILGRYLEAKRIDYCRIDGRTDMGTRSKELKRFTDNDDVPDGEIFGRDRDIRRILREKMADRADKRRKKWEKQRRKRREKQNGEIAPLLEVECDMVDVLMTGETAGPDGGGVSDMAAGGALVAQSVTATAGVHGTATASALLDQPSSLLGDEGLAGATAPPSKKRKRSEQGFKLADEGIDIDADGAIVALDKSLEDISDIDPDEVDVSRFPDDFVLKIEQGKMRIKRVPFFPQRRSRNPLEEHRFYKPPRGFRPGGKRRNAEWRQQFQHVVLSSDDEEGFVMMGGQRVEQNTKRKNLEFFKGTTARAPTAVPDT